MLRSTLVAPSSRKAIWVPHAAQNSRPARGEERYVAGEPFVYAKASFGNEAQANTGAPLDRWQTRQWQ